MNSIETFEEFQSLCESISNLCDNELEEALKSNPGALLESADGKESFLKKVLRLLSNLIEKLHKFLDSKVDNKISAAEKERTELLKKITKLEDDIKSKNTTIENKAKLVKAVIKEIEELEEELAKSDRRYEELGKRYSDDYDKFTKMIDEGKITEQELTAKINELKRTLKSIEKYTNLKKGAAVLGNDGLYVHPVVVNASSMHNFISKMSRLERLAQNPVIANDEELNSIKEFIDDLNKAEGVPISKGKTLDKSDLDSLHKLYTYFKQCADSLDNKMGAKNSNPLLVSTVKSAASLVSKIYSSYGLMIRDSKEVE